jgi:exodeoxyribonuclease V beta subunit
VADVRALIGRDVAAEVVRTLAAARVADDGRWRPARPGDMAVLTRRNVEALAVQAELADAGVPAVISGAASVFGTQAARDWLVLLDALAEPGHPGRTAALALTAFVGWDAPRLAAAEEAERERLAQTVRDWSQVLLTRGVGALTEALVADGLTERAMAGGGERVLTDLRHVAEAMQQVSVAEHPGVVRLAAWLRRRLAEAGADYAEERSRRLETDRDAVQVLTVHASKGLEFPIVYVPFAWDRYEPDEPAVLRFHDGGGRRIVHVGGSASEHYEHARRRHRSEERGEDLRLLYVALTRARSQVVIWWAPSRISAGGPLTRVLLGDHAPSEQPPDRVSVPEDEAVARRLGDRATASGGTISVERVEAAPAIAPWAGPVERGPDPGALAVAPWRRRLDLTWRRLSYSALTAQAHVAATATGAMSSSEPEVSGVVDEPISPPTTVESAGSTEPVDPTDPGDLPAADRSCPLGDLPSGAAFGTLVHDVLERLDPAATTRESLPDTVLALARRRAGGQLSAGRLDVLADGLAQALSTPLGPLADGLRLRDVAARDRLCELEFELPLAGGDRSAGSARPARLSDVATLLRRHLGPGDVLAGYPDRLDALADESLLRGYLTGSIDAVLRVGPPQRSRYLVVDYKTNRLAPVDQPLRVWHYRPQALAEAMLAAHYPLQLVLYLVALHRFLRWRQPGYDPQVHLGGGLYLFLRGMCSTTDPDGVLAWRPPASLVVELSALLDGGGG